MEVQEIDPYEQQLLAEFESCDKRQQGALDIDGLEELCDKLQLEDLGLELIKYLLKDVTCKRVTFCEFRDGLLSLLRDKQNIKQKSNSDRRSPEREVSPKFVFGTKKYGRRSRPVSTDHEGDQRINLNDSDSEIFVTIDADENEVLMVSNPEEQKQSKKRKSNSETNSPINHVVKQQHRTTDNESDVFNESGDPPSLNGFNESIEEGLREACERLGVGQDGYLDKRELSLLCQAIGMEKMAEEIVQQLFDKLKRDRSGKIGLEEFFLLLRNGDNCFQSVESIDTDTEKINDNFQQTLTNEEHSVRDKDHFLTFGSQNMGFVSGEVLIEMWESAGVSQASTLLQELGFSESHQINISELTSLLEDELRTLNEAKENEGVKTVCSPYEPLLHALLVLCQIEIRSLKCTIEHMSAERDKLRADILDANQRASLLAQEVDDHHARLEKSSQLQVKLLEQRFSEQLKDMTEQLSQERDQMTVQNLALERRLASLQEEEAKLRNDLAACKVENEALETENQSLLEQLTVIQESQTALQSQVESLEGLQLLMTEMEGDRQHEEVVPLLEKVSKLEEENMELRDQYDELNTKFENLTAQLSSKMKLSPDAAQDNSEGIEDGDSVGVSVATKRRGDSSPLLHVEDISDEESPRMGKVRRCCKERNLSEVSSAPVTMEDLQPFHLGESSVEANLEIENNMDEKSPNQYDDQGWMCNNITSLAEDEKNVEIERLRSRISALEDELVKQASHSTVS